MARMHPPKYPKQIIKPFKPEHIARLLTMCDYDSKNRNNFLGLRNRSIILTFLDTGLRLSELANIQLQDIDFDRESIKVMGKGSKEKVSSHK
jgi:integrase/recombinase XerC